MRWARPVIEKNSRSYPGLMGIPAVDALELEPALDGGDRGAEREVRAVRAATSERSDQMSAARGRLRVYLGAAPGVGKTYEMLEEGRRRGAAAPTWSSAWSRPTAGRTPAELLGDLEVDARAGR